MKKEFVYLRGLHDPVVPGGIDVPTEIAGDKKSELERSARQFRMREIARESTERIARVQTGDDTDILSMTFLAGSVAARTAILEGLEKAKSPTNFAQLAARIQLFEALPPLRRHLHQLKAIDAASFRRTAVAAAIISLDSSDTSAIDVMIDATVNGSLDEIVFAVQRCSEIPRSGFLTVELDRLVDHLAQLSNAKDLRVFFAALPVALQERPEATRSRIVSLTESRPFSGTTASLLSIIPRLSPVDSAWLLGILLSQRHTLAHGEFLRLAVAAPTLLGVPELVHATTTLLADEMPLARLAGCGLLGEIRPTGERRRLAEEALVDEPDARLRRLLTVARGASP